MFRALLLFQGDNASASSTPPENVVLEPPLSVTLLGEKEDKYEPVQLAIKREDIFTTAVGHSSKRTLAVWHVTTPEEIVEHMLHLVADVSNEASTDQVPAAEEKSNL